MHAARVIIAILCLLGLGLATAFALDEAIIRQSERAAASYRAVLQRIEQEMRLPNVTDQQLAGHRTQLEDIRTGALTAAGSLDASIREVDEQIKQLGPLPAEGPGEAQAVAAQRKILNDVLSSLQGAEAQLQLVSLEAEQLAGRAASIQRGQFVKRVFEGGRSILNPLLWYDAGLGLAQFTQRLGALLSNWRDQVAGTANYPWLAFAPAFLLALAAIRSVLQRRLSRWRMNRGRRAEEPHEFDRLWRVFRATAGMFLAILLGLIFPVYLSLYVGGFLTPRFQLVLDAVLETVLAVAVFYVFVNRIGSPGQPQWRIVDLDDRSAGRFTLLSVLTAAISVSSQKAGELADALYLPVTYTIGQSAVVAVVMLLLLSLILLTLGNQTGFVGKPPTRRFFLKWVETLIPLYWLLIGVAAVALVFGYVALGNFIAVQIFETSVLIAVLFLVHHLSDAAVSASIDPNTGFGRLLRRATHLGERGIGRLGLLFRTIVDLVLVFAGLPLLFLQWTVTWIDFRSLANTAFFGFRVGDITISLSTVLLVLAVLVAGIVITNLTIRWLDRRIMSETRIDKGVQDSVRKGSSYAGYIIAAGFAFSAAGLELSNLAIIAGALGVGIGFGLQSIVNNFVSGLILLAERPVRVGDWVVLAAGEGIVKRINVRSTEIETFDSCSVIVPNSVLVAEAVKNWTHGDTIGRFLVAVTVVYDSDAEAVRDLLLEIARAHPKVLTYPEPHVMLARFGPAGLDFEVRAHVADVFEGVIVASDLRYVILAAFAERGFTIALAPAVVTVK